MPEMKHLNDYLEHLASSLGIFRNLIAVYEPSIDSKNKEHLATMMNFGMKGIFVPRVINYYTKFIMWLRIISTNSPISFISI